MRNSCWRQQRSNPINLCCAVCAREYFPVSVRPHYQGSEGDELGVETSISLIDLARPWYRWTIYTEKNWINRARSQLAWLVPNYPLAASTRPYQGPLCSSAERAWMTDHGTWRTQGCFDSCRQPCDFPAERSDSCHLTRWLFLACSAGHNWRRIHPLTRIWKVESLRLVLSVNPETTRAS